MPLDNSYVSNRILQLENTHTIPKEIVDNTTGFYRELVNFLIYKNLGLNIESSENIKSLTEAAKVNGDWKNVMYAGERMSSIIEADYRARQSEVAKRKRSWNFFRLADI